MSVTKIKLIIGAAMLLTAAPAMALPADFKAQADALVKSAWSADEIGRAHV